MKSKYLLLILAFVYVYIVFNKACFKDNKVLNWDKAGYYLYLPASFIYNDLDRFDFYKNANQQYHFTPGADDYSLYPQPNGRRVNKYAIGVSVLQLPFFLIAHQVTKITHTYPPDGFSQNYQLSIVLSVIFYVVMGFVFLRKWLLKYFPDATVALVLLLLGFGTNLYQYTVFDYGMSHPYSFFLFTGALLFTDHFFRQTKTKDAILAALFLGMITITRPTNILLLLALLFIGLNHFSEVKERVRTMASNVPKLLIALLLFIAVLFIQMGYWKYATGHWIYYSYVGEGFNFKNPELWKGLFSYRKGWFIYSPLAFFALFGFLFGFKKHKAAIVGLLVFLCADVYVVFSWYQWYYGGGFGARPMVEVTAVLAFPLAMLANHFQKQAKPIRNVAISTLVCIAMFSAFQAYQYSLSILPWDHNNRVYYWRVFGKTERSEEDWKLIDWND